MLSSQFVTYKLKWQKMSLFRFATLPVGGVFTETRRQCNTESQTSLTGLVQPQYQVRENLLVKVVI